jgi:GR25 family glycosyltransferase involved in LPS biosynthesis
MKYLDKIFWLNLDRRPDRKQHFLQQCDNEYISENILQRFSALDGLSYILSEDEKNLFSKNYSCDIKYINKVQCNQLGHYYMLKEIVDKKYENVLIVQDDVVFCKNFIDNVNNVLEHMPNDAEFVHIGLHMSAFYDKSSAFPLDELENDSIYYEQTKINEFICKGRHTVHPASLGFICTQKGAQKMLQYIISNKFDNATDHFYNNYHKNQDIFYISRKILCTGNPNLGSDIFTGHSNTNS